MTTELGVTVFDTAIGWCGLAWSDRGVVAVQLPERDRAATAARLRRRAPAAHECEPVDAVRVARDGIVALLAAERVDLSGTPLDLRDATPFESAVYEIVRAIPHGETMTYGTIAAALGTAGDARAVGQAMGRNPCPLVVPCHRVLAANGTLGGFSAYGGVTTKRRLLFIEGALDSEALTLFDA